MSEDLSSVETGLHYLWHLEAIGLITPESRQADTTSDNSPDYHLNPKWLEYNNTKLGELAAKVVIIDNGCVADHPNLPETRVRNSIDFSYDVCGTIYGSELEDCDLFSSFPSEENLHNQYGFKLADVLAEHANISSALSSTLLKLSKRDLSPRHIRQVNNPSNRMAAHGTACAGLVGADASTESNNSAVIEYAGVDKHAHIIPVATVYSHEYWPLVMALLYALAQEADVILIPRAVEELADTDKPLNRARQTGFSHCTTLAAEKALFEALLEKISMKIPVVIAAGNVGANRLEYPAKLVTQTDFSQLIVVGAVNSNGYRSSYSSYIDERFPFYYAPSDDSEVYTESEFRLDDFSHRAARIGYGASGSLNTQDETEKYSPYSLVALDIPGAYGYDFQGDRVIDKFDNLLPQYMLDKLETSLELQPKSLYATFGGTSAAASIVAGIVSMLQGKAKTSKKDKRALTTDEVKDILDKSLGAIHLPAQQPLINNRADQAATAPDSLIQNAVRADKALAILDEATGKNTS